MLTNLRSLVLKSFALVAALILIGGSAASGDSGVVVEPAPPAPTSPGSTFSAVVTEMPDGTMRLWQTVAKRGSTPGYLAEIDPVTTQLLNTYSLPADIAGSWGVDVDADGNVYLGSHVRGSLFRLSYGADALTEIAKPLGGTSYLWRVAVADDGRVVSGTYEGYAPKGPGHLVAWDPEAETWRDYGTFGTAVSVRSVEVVGTTAYAGVGTKAGLHSVDLDTGDREQIPLPEQAQNCDYVYDMSWNGEALFVHFQGCGASADLGFVYDVEARSWGKQIPGFTGQDVTAPLPDGSVYLSAGGMLQSWDGVKLTPTSISLTYGVGMGWIKDPDSGDVLVIGGDRSGGVFNWNTKTSKGFKTYASENPTTAVSPTVKKIGDIPLRAVTVSAGDVVTMPNGDQRIWAIATGTPAYLAEIDPSTNRLLRKWDMPGSIGGWGVTVSPDGSVYATSYVGGYMFRLAPGEDELVNLGRPRPETSFLWRADADRNGRVYTGTFEGYAPGELPPAHLVSWSPETGSWEDHGSFGPEFGYVRTVTAVDDRVYVGLGSVKPGLFVVDPTTDEKKQIELPPTYTGCQFVYETSYAEERLFVKLSGCAEADPAGLVLDTRTDRWVADLGAYGGQDVVSDGDGSVYLAADGKLSVFDVATSSLVPTGFSLASIRGIGIFTDEVTGERVATGITMDGDVWRYELDSGTATASPVTGMEAAGVKPRRTAIGPDGRVYVSGYFSGGLAAYDPIDSSWEPISWRHQAEQMVTLGDKLYIGVYPGAQIWQFDVDQAFSGSNPRKLFALEGQDRPSAMVPAGDKLAIGTVPGYGQSSGMVALYDPKTGDVQEFPDIVGAQSVVSLVYRDGILYGGTSVWGGGGTTASETEARIFALDVKRGKVLWSRAAVPGHKQVSALTFDGEGRLWGITVGTAFVADPATGEVSRAVEYFPQNWQGMNGTYANLGSLYFDATDGMLYGNTFAKSLRIDPDSWRNTAPAAQAQGMTVAHPATGRGYWFAGQDLYEVAWHGDVATQGTPRTSASVSPAANAAGWHNEDVEVTLAGYEPWSTRPTQPQYAREDGAWVAYTGPVVIDADGVHEIAYRSVVQGAAAESIGTVRVQRDATAPVTALAETASGFELSVVENGSGVERTEYRLNGGGWVAVDGPVDLRTGVAATDSTISSADGAATTVEYRSVDIAGNVEDTHSATLATGAEEPGDGAPGGSEGDGGQQGGSGDDTTGTPGGDLATTGADSTPLIMVAALLLVVGGATAVLARRRVRHGCQR